MFRGRYLRKMNKGVIYLPKNFVQDINKGILDILIIRKGFLILIPQGKSAKKIMEREKKESNNILPREQVFYKGVLKLKMGNKLFIPSNMRKLSGIYKKEIIILGCGNSIEIWDREVWEREVGFADV